MQRFGVLVWQKRGAEPPSPPKSTTDPSVLLVGQNLRYVCFVFLYVFTRACMRGNMLAIMPLVQLLSNTTAVSLYIDQHNEMVSDFSENMSGNTICITDWQLL